MDAAPRIRSLSAKLYKLWFFRWTLSAPRRGFRFPWLQTTAQPLSDAPLIRSFFTDLEFLDSKMAQNPKEAETLLSEETVRMFEPGCDIEGSINETKDYGILIDIDEGECGRVGFSAPSA